MKRKQKQEADQQRAMELKQMDAQTKMQVQQMQAQQEAQKMEFEAQNEMKIKQAEIAFDIEKMKNEAILKSQLMEKEYQYNLGLKGIQESQINSREKEREQAKDKRISQANTQQSQLINQRKNNLPPIDFESNEDSLDGFDLAQFEPR